MRKIFLVAAFLLSTSVYTDAQELQIPGTDFTAAVGIFGSVNGGSDGLILPNTLTSNRTIGEDVDGPGLFGGTSDDNIGLVPDGTDFPLTINAAEAFTDLGGGDFEFVISIRSSALNFDGSGRGISGGDLAPAVFGSEQRSSLALVLGQSVGLGNGPAGSDPLNLQTNEHFLTSATLEAFDLQDGTDVAALGFATLDLNNPAFADTNGDGAPEFNGFGVFELDNVIGEVGLVRLTLNGTLGPATTVPEPSCMALLVAGLGIGFRRRRVS